MKILFTPISNTAPSAEDPLHQAIRREKPDQVCLFITAETAAQEEPFKAALETLSAEIPFEVKSIIQPDHAAGEPGDPLQSDLFAALAMIDMEYPDAEVVFSREGCSDAFLTALDAVIADNGGSDEPEAEQPADPPAADAPADDAQPADAAPETDAAAEPAVDSEPEEEDDESEKLLFASNCMTVSRLIDAYDYQAALIVSRQMESLLSPEFFSLLEAAALRGNTGIITVQQAFRKCGHEKLVEGANQMTEYYIQLDLYLKRRMYAEFVRALPPFILEIIIAAIRKQFNLDVTKYFIYSSRKWDHNKLVLDQMSGKFKESYVYHTKPKPGALGTYVTTANLSALIENLSVPKKDGQLVLDTLKLRLEIEEKLRSMTTYSVQAITQSEIQKATTRNAEDLLAQIKAYICSYTDIPLSDALLASLEQTNGLLKAYL